MVEWLTWCGKKNILAKEKEADLMLEEGDKPPPPSPPSAFHPQPPSPSSASFPALRLLPLPSVLFLCPPPRLLPVWHTSVSTPTSASFRICHHFVQQTSPLTIESSCWLLEHVCPHFGSSVQANVTYESIRYTQNKTSWVPFTNTSSTFISYSYYQYKYITK